MSNFTGPTFGVTAAKYLATMLNTNTATETNSEPFPTFGTTDRSHILTWLRKRYADAFNNDKATALPSRRQTDHATELKPGTEPPFMRTYNLSPNELQALKEFITEALAKGRIRESTLLVHRSYFHQRRTEDFVCVDYRGLNAITVKNRYPIPLISELLDWLDGAKIFSKIDLKDAYYRIRIQDIIADVIFQYVLLFRVSFL
jgi:hypothetical protein